MGVVENMKDVADLIKKLGDIDLNRRILNLEEEVLDLSREKRRADEKVEELERALNLKQNLLFEDNYYYIQRGDAKEGPYCSACWDRNKNLIRIHSGMFGYGCPVCIKETATKRR